MVEAAMPRIAASRTGPAWCSVRAATICAVVSGGVCRGMRCGREERSASPASPSARQRCIHLETVCRLTPSCLATSPGRWPARTRSTISLRANTVVRALAWATETSGWKRRRQAPPLLPEVSFVIKPPRRVSTTSLVRTSRRVGMNGRRVVGRCRRGRRLPSLHVPSSQLRPGVVVPPAWRGGMFFGGGLGVGLTVADPAPPPPEFGPPVSGSPPLGDLLPVWARSPEEKAAELQRVQRLEAELAAYELELVAGFAADRPASADRQPG